MSVFPAIGGSGFHPVDYLDSGMTIDLYLRS